LIRRALSQVFRAGSAVAINGIDGVLIKMNVERQFQYGGGSVGISGPLLRKNLTFPGNGGRSRSAISTTAVGNVATEGKESPRWFADLASPDVGPERRWEVTCHTPLVQLLGLSAGSSS
jgi:hypothetical protein